MFKKILIFSVTALIFLNTLAVAAVASDIIGFIDAQMVLVAHPKYEESQRYLDDFITRKSDEARAAAEIEPDPSRRMVIIDEARQASGMEEMRIMNPITVDINKIIETVAQSRGVTIVLEKVYIFFGGVDLTDDVVRGVRALR